MSEMEKLLEEKMDEFESARRQAMKFVQENQKELSKNYAYAEELTKPLTENQIFFCLENRTKGGELCRFFAPGMPEPYLMPAEIPCRHRSGQNR